MAVFKNVCTRQFWASTRKPLVLADAAVSDELIPEPSHRSEPPSPLANKAPSKQSALSVRLNGEREGPK